MIVSKRVWLLPVVLVLSACNIYGVKDENSTFYAVPVGSSLVLNQDVIISGDQVAIYVQDGEIMSYDVVEKYYPNCKFEIYTISEQPRTVEQDTFVIVKVQDEIESSSIQKNTQVASLDNAFMFGAMGRVEVFNYATMLYLHSERQNDVYRMTCQHWEEIRDGRYLSVAQMRKAMGEVFTLVIKD